MIASTIENVESLRIMRAQGNLTVTGGRAAGGIIRCDQSPEMRRNENTGEVFLPANAEIQIANSVAIEILDVAANIEVENFGGNLAIGRVGGNLELRECGSVAVRGKVGGNCRIHGAQTVDVEHVRRNVEV